MRIALSASPACPAYTKARAWKNALPTSTETALTCVSRVPPLASTAPAPEMTSARIAKGSNLHFLQAAGVFPRARCAHIW